MKLSFASFKKRNAVVKQVCLLLIFFAFANFANAQVIVETFEGSNWASGLSANEAIANGTHTVSAFASSATQKITIYSNGGNNTQTTSTVAASISSSWPWGVSSASICAVGSYAGNGGSAHSETHILDLGGGGGYLITPVIPGGITSVTFYTSSVNGCSGVNFYVGLNTTNTAAVYPTATSTLEALFNKGTSTFNGSGSASGFTYTPAGTLTSAPAQLVFFYNNGCDLGLDDIVINGSVAAGPVITGAATATAFTTTYGTASTAQSFNISGANMTAGITVTPATGYEVSKTSATTGFAGSGTAITVGSSGTIASTPIWIRLAATAPVGTTTYNSNNIVLSSTGASNVNIVTASSGNSVSAYAITITANNVNKTYGTAITGGAGSTAYTITTGTLQNTDAISSITIAYGTGSAASAAVGTYSSSAVVPSAAVFGTGSAGNYTITYANGNIIVGAYSITITANNVNKTYGTAITGGTGSTAYTITTGTLQNTDAISSITIAYGTGSAATAAVGTYSSSAVVPSSPVFSTGSAGNYNISYANGNIIVGKATLTITANPQTVCYGTAATAVTSAGTYTPSGFFNGDNSSVIGGSATYTTTYTATTAGGTAGVTITPVVSGLTATNYTFAAAAGTITINSTPTAATAGANYYYVVVSNTNGCTVNSSVSGAVTVNAVPAATSPIGVKTYCLNATATALSVSAVAGSGSIATYKWYSNGTPSTSGSTLVATHTSSATSDTYTPLTTSAGTLYYYCVVTNTDGAVYTSGFSDGVLTRAGFTAGTIASTTQTICYNTSPANITYSTAPSGGSTPQYQWYEQTGSITAPSGAFAIGSWTAIGTASTSTPTLTGATIGNLTATTTFALRVTDIGSSGCYDSWNGDAQVVTVDAAFSGGTLSSTAQTICYNTSPSDITYSTSPSGGTTPQYQWYEQTGSIAAPSGAFAIGSWTAIGSASTSTPTLSGSTIGNLTATTTFALRVTDVGSTACYDNWAGNAQVVTVTLNPSGTTISYASNPCSSSGTATVTLTGIPGGTFSSTTGLTIDPSSGNINIGTSIAGVYTITYTIPTSGCFSTYTTTTTNTIMTNTWIGATSTDWTDGTNWACGSSPASNFNVRVLNGVPYYPAFPATGAIDTINSLELDGSATINIDSAQGYNTFLINGTISGSGGLIGSSTASLILGSPSTGTVNFVNYGGYGQSLWNLTLASNAIASLGTPLSIVGSDPFEVGPGTLSIGSSSILYTGGGLTLASTDTNTAQVTPVYGSVIGNVTVQRYVRSSQNTAYANGSNEIISSAKRAWRLMTAPISNYNASPVATIFNSWQAGAPSTYTPGIGTFITGPGATGPTGNGLDTVGINGNYTIDSFNRATQHLAGIGNTISTSTAAISGSTGSADNIGYFLFIRGDRNDSTIGNPNYGGLLINNTTLSATGSLQTGQQVFPVLSSGAFPDAKFTLIGNPYMSPVNLDLVAFNNFPSPTIYNPTTVYTWDPSLNQVGGYIAFQNTGSGFYHSGTPATNQTNIIQSSQAFFVQGSTNSGQNLTFNESSKSDTNNNLVFRPAGSADEYFTSNLYLLNTDSTVLADGNQAYFNSNYSPTVNYSDALKLANVNETFALLLDGYSLAIQRTPIVSIPDTLYFKLTNTTVRNYQFQFIDSIPIPPGLIAVLQDSYTGDSTILSIMGTTTVNFSVTSDTASQRPTRFMVILEQSGSIVPVTYTSIKAWQQSSSNIAVQWTVNNQLNVKEYLVEKSTDGVNFTQVGTVKSNGINGSSFTYNWMDENGVTGYNYYRIISVGNNGTEEYSNDVRVNIGAGAPPAIAVYPNPVEGGVLGLQFTNMPAGKYSIRMLDNIGQVIIDNEVNHAGGSATETIRFNKNLAKGLYHLAIVGPANYQDDIKVVY